MKTFLFDFFDLILGFSLTRLLNITVGEGGSFYD